jgi:thiamine kinase-like enzyme
MVTKYMDADQMTEEEYHQEENIIKMAEITKDLHGRKTDYFFDPYEDVEKKLCYIKHHNIAMHERFDEAYGIYKAKREANPIFEQQYLGLCHNDINPENFLVTKDKQRIYMIDYEFAGMGNIFFDLTCNVGRLPAEKQQLFFKAYFGGYQEYMTQKISDFWVVVMMWNILWAYLKSLAPGGNSTDYMNYANQWVDLILRINANHGENKI